MKYKKALFVGLIVSVGILLSGCGLRDSGGGSPYMMPLQVWGVFDDSDVYAPIFQEYRALNPYAGEIGYRKFSEETYKKEILNALAAGNGPDLFMIRNSWIEEFKDKIVPAPDYQMTEKEVRDGFVDVVAHDFIGETDKKIYGLPLSVDSLALYYNKDIFNAAGITAPPTTWEELSSLVPRLTKIDEYGNITQSAIALGTADNINRAPAILMGMMFGLGAEIEDEQGRINLFRTDAPSKALSFYSQFSRVGSSLYTWNPRMHYSIDAFYEGTLGMMVNYSWRYETLKQKNAKLNMAIAPLPQFTGMTPKNYADYWTYVVAKNHDIVLENVQEDAKMPQDKAVRNKLRIHEAWQLLSYLALPHPSKQITFRNGLTGNPGTFVMATDPTEQYLLATKKPAARRDLVEKQRNDTVLGAFAVSNLVAKNFRQSDADTIEKIMNDMISRVNRGEATVQESLSSAQNRINTLK